MLKFVEISALEKKSVDTLINLSKAFQWKLIENPEMQSLLT